MITRYAIVPSLALGFAIVSQACHPTAASTDESMAMSEPTAFELPGEQLFPEGITVDRSGALYVSSVTQGTVFRAVVGEERAEPFVDVGGGAVGVLADDARDLLWVCRSNPMDLTVAPAVLVVGLSDGEQKAIHTFPGETGFCNDFAIDTAGNVYVSDSWGHRILRIAASDVESGSPAEVWVDDPALVVPDGTFGVNGMAIDDGVLHVVMYETGTLLQVGIDDAGRPGSVVEVPLTRPLGHPDGLRLEAPGQLLVVEGSLGSLSRIELNDDGPASVEPVLTELDSPTTVAVNDGVAWLVVSQFDHLFGADPSPATVPFTVVGLGMER